MVTLRFSGLVAFALVLSACATNVVAEKASRFDQAVAAYDAGDYPGAYRIWSELAAEDDLAAMRNAAQLLRQGKGVAKDVQRAFNLYVEAAEKGLVTAMANVAEMYLAGEGVERNPQAAAAWYARAATAGLSLAQMKLAEMYEQGIGVARDTARARALVERAARNGYAPAQAKLKTMPPAAQPDAIRSSTANDPWQGGGKVSSSAASASEKRTRPSASAPISSDLAASMPAEDLAQIHAGLTAYAARNHTQAFTIWRSLAARGNPDAQLRVALLYEHGEGVAQDLIEAYRWLKLAANQGYAKAIAELSIVSAQLAPAERAIAESLAASPPSEDMKTR